MVSLIIFPSSPLLSTSFAPFLFCSTCTAVWNLPWLFGSWWFYCSNKTISSTSQSYEKRHVPIHWNEKDIGHLFFFNKDFIYLTERERECTNRGSSRQREKQAPHWAWSPMWGLIPGLGDQDLSRRRMLHRQRCPGTRTSDFEKKLPQVS